MGRPKGSKNKVQRGWLVPCLECGTCYRTTEYGLSKKKFCSVPCKESFRKKHYVVSEDTKKKMSESLKGNFRVPFNSNHKNMSWIHSWVKQNYGKANYCHGCGLTGPVLTKGGTNYFHWSNKFDHYSKEKDQWWTLCFRCHNLYDNLTKALKYAYHSGRLRSRWQKYFSKETRGKDRIRLRALFEADYRSVRVLHTEASTRPGELGD